MVHVGRHGELSIGDGYLSKINITGKTYYEEDIIMIYDANDKEFDCLVKLFQSYRTMVDVLGWKEIHNVPDDTKLWIIEVGSTGIHEGWKDDLGFWIFDGNDTYSSNPILFKIRG
jgi:hypothetical protein